jgi:integrase/recombinase XerD
MAGSQLLHTLVLEYLEEIEIKGRAAITAKRYREYLEAFLIWLAATRHKNAGALRLGDIDAEGLRQYRLYLARRRDTRDGHVVGAATRNLYQVALRNFLRHCRRQAPSLPDPDEALELAKVRDREIRHVERDEVTRMTKAIALDEPNGLRDRAVLETLFGTGCRVSELCAMTRRQVDLDQREAEVIGKGGKSRLVLLTEDAAHWIRRYVETREDDAPHLFVSRRHDDEGQPRPISVRQVQRLVDDAAKRAGLPVRVSPHWLRHSRLTVLARHAGVQAAQRIAGHASLQTTSRYLHLSDPQLRTLYDQAERADKDR